ncbi:MAG: Shedu anti-phage system protein SduA domain-containing protein, partial [Flavobacterium sp.]
DRLFTGKLTPANKLQTAIGQITDWNQWVTTNRQTFVKEGLELLKKAPLFPKQTANGSFKCMPNNKIESTWNAFGGFEHCYISNLIIIGRWSKLNEKERKRLLFHNTNSQQHFFQIRTFDQLIRKGYDGPPMFW